MCDTKKSTLSISEKELWGHKLFVVDSWSEGATQFAHGFFSATLDVKNGCDEFNKLSALHRKPTGPTLLRVKQVHGSDWVELTQRGDTPKFSLVKASGVSTEVSLEALANIEIEADGWISNTSLLARFNLALGIATADCIPVLGYCRTSGLSFALHCGWRSAVAGILPKALSRICELGGVMSNFEIAMGPGASFEIYEVDRDVADEITRAANNITGEHEKKNYNTLQVVKRGNNCDDKFFVNIPGLLKLQALNAGISEHNICMFSGCTIKDKRFFSYRREGDLAGRQLSFIGCKQ